MMLRSRMLSVTVLAACLAVCLTASVAVAEENAALRSRGAMIHVTCDHPRPLNDKWHKPIEMIKAERPAGPIIHDLPSAVMTVKLPVKMTVQRVGILSADYKGGMAMAKDIVIEAPGHEPKKATLTQETKEVQFFDYAARTDTVVVKVTSIYPPKDEKTDQNRKYGTINQVQVIVEESLDELFAIPESYVSGLPTYVMRTPNLDPMAKVEVIGEPRVAEGHPCTIWDKQSIAEIKAQIAEFPKAREAYESIVAYCDKAIEKKMSVPDEPDNGDNPEVAAQHNAVAIGIGNLGIGYALSGNDAYAAEAKRLLLELAARYEGWPVHQHPRFRHDKAKWSWQRLNEAIWLIPAAWGYDLIHDSKVLTDADRKQIEEHFILPCGKFIIDGSSGSLRAPTNWSAIMAASAMVAGRVCGDDRLYESALWGKKRDPENISGGIYFYIDEAIDDDGLWGEGAIGYQFMAMRGLLVMAETAWHNGVDVYGYNDGRLKYVFDSPIWYCYPGGNSSPAVHDSGSASLFGRDAHLYQYARRRYGDKTYNAILRHVEPSLETVYNLFLPSVDFAPVEAADLPEVPSTLFKGVGFAITRHGAGDEEKYLFLDYGPKRSHGHPDKLNFNLFALGQELFADAGSAWYSTDVYQYYYSHSLAHNTVTGNGASQIITEGNLEAYGSLGELAMIRASCDSAIPGTMLDRTLLLSGDRLYDVMHVASGLPMTFDLPYHCHGTMEQSVATEPWADHPKDAKGYKYFSDPVAAKVDGDWSCTWQLPRGRVDAHFIGEPGTEVIIATTPKGAAECPTAMLRRQKKLTNYACAMDVVQKQPKSGQHLEEGQAGPATIKSVKKLEAGGSGYGLVTDLVDGGREVLLVNFTGSPVTLGQYKTDARAAFLQTDADGKLTGFYVAGGTTTTGPGGIRVETSAPALVACRTVKDGLAHVANQSDSPAEITVAGMAGFDASYALKRDGARAGKAGMKAADGGLALSTEKFATYELTRGSQPTVAEYEAELRREKIEAMIREEERQRKEMLAAAEKQRTEAARANVPAGTYYLIQAFPPDGESGGEVNDGSKKTGVFGTAFSGWNDPKHWLEYHVEVEHSGWYQVAVKYCREGGPVTRSLQIDGEYPLPAFREVEFATTGGWSNGADNWKVFRFDWPMLENTPFLVHLEKGKHTIRLDNVSGGGLNLDWIVLAEPRMDITREAVEK